MAKPETAQQNLAEPVQADWDSLTKSSKYQAPPQAMKDGKLVVYTGSATKVVEEPNQYEVDDEGRPYLNYNLDPITLNGNGNGVDGYQIRFERVSTKPFRYSSGEPVKGNPNALALFLAAAGVQAKPQTNSEYRAAMNIARSKRFAFTVDWVAKNRETGEQVRGYDNFPDDPDNPGQKKSILKAGDTVTERDRDGNITGTRTITSEVLFANAKVRRFKNAAPKVGG